MRAGADADIDAARDHDLDRLAASLRVEGFEHEAVLLEDAGVLAELRDALLPAAALADGDLERILGAGTRVKSEEREREGEAGQR